MSNSIEVINLSKKYKSLQNHLGKIYFLPLYSLIQRFLF